MGYINAMYSIRTTDSFDNWFMGLRDVRARVRIQTRIDRLEMGNPGDSKSVGGGIVELRINYGPGYRVYYVQRGNVLVVLLCGGDKSSQQNDIAFAKEIAAYLDAVLEEAGDDPKFIIHALGVMARAHGMSQLARESGIKRESLYLALSEEGNPEFATIWKVVRALGIRLHAQPA